jgi:hypothetical protein
MTAVHRDRGQVLQKKKPAAPATEMVVNAREGMGNTQGRC